MLQSKDTFLELAPDESLVVTARCAPVDTGQLERMSEPTLRQKHSGEETVRMCVEEKAQAVEASDHAAVTTPSRRGPAFPRAQEPEGTTHGPECATDRVSIGRRIIRNTISLTTSIAVSAVLSLFATAYLARILGAEGFGVLGFAQAVVTYFAFLVDIGFTHYGTREVARNPKHVKRYVHNVVTMRLALAVAAYALLLLFTLLIPKPPVVKVALFLFGTGFFHAAVNIRWVFQGWEKMGWVALHRLLPQVVYVACVFALVRQSDQLLRVPMIQVGTAAVGSMLLLGIYWHGQGMFRITVDWGFWKRIFRQSLPMGASYILSQLYVNFDTIMLGFTHGEGTVGYYSAAYKMMLMLNLFWTYYLLSLFPNLSRMYLESIDKLRALLDNSLRCITILLIPCAVGGTILAGGLVRAIFGEGYEHSVMPLAVLIWNVVIINVRQHFGNALIACDRQTKYLKGALLGAVVNIGLNAIFIPRYGIPAAAITTLVSELVVLFHMYGETNRFVPLKILHHFPRPVFAAAGMGGILYVLPNWNVFLLVAIGGASYFPLLYILGGIKSQDFVALRRMLQHRR